MRRGESRRLISRRDGCSTELPRGNEVSAKEGKFQPEKKEGVLSSKKRRKGTATAFEEGRRGKFFLEEQLVHASIKRRSNPSQ